MGLSGVGLKPDPAVVQNIYRQAWPPPVKGALQKGNSDYGMKVNREWVTSQLKKMRDMASSRDVTHHMMRGTSVDGATDHNFSVLDDGDTCVRKGTVLSFQGSFVMCGLKHPGSSRLHGVQQTNQTSNPTAQQNVNTERSQVQDVLREATRFTQSEYRKFSDQVKDTADSCASVSRGTGFKELEVLEQLSESRLTYRGERVPGLTSVGHHYDVTLCRYLGNPTDSSKFDQTSPESCHNDVFDPQKKFYYNEKGENVPVIYRSQLARSLRAFQDKRWLPYHVQQAVGSEELVGQTPKSRPGSSASSKRTNSRPSSSAQSSRIRRPQSTPLVLPQEPQSRREEDLSDQTCYNYDSLTPAVLYDLANGQLPESIYGEKPVPVADDEIRSKDGEDEDNVIDPPKGDRDKIGTAERESDDDSDDENIPEPEVDKIEMANIPNLRLRPEKADALHVPWTKGDLRKYDFDAEHIEQPAYEFKDPLSSQAMNLNLKDLSRIDRNWRDMVSIKPVDALESKLISRLIEFEKLQRKTIDTERERRLRGVRGLKSRASTPQTNSRSRTDMNCCPDCIQMACVGNCPRKKLPSGVCIFCSEKGCKENCQLSVYESRTRIERSNVEDDVRTKPVRPKTCTSCQQRNSSKMSTNNRIMNRPRSGYTQKITPARPRESKPRLPFAFDCNNDLDEEFAKLDIVTDDDRYIEKERPHTAGSVRRFKGRAAIIPGKSFFSQRRESLTDITKEEKIRLAVIATKKRLRSAKKKRPKTAMEDRQVEHLVPNH